MKILIPTDFSANADHAIKYGAMLGKAVNADLILMNVYTPPVTRGNVAYPLITEEKGRMTREATEKLLNLSTTVSEDYGIRCEHQVRIGNPVDEIVKEAEVRAIDLIVMGTVGASGISRIVFGSNTAFVMEKAPCPVFAVPTNSTLALPKKVVFATNYADNDIQAVKDLIKITQPLRAELTLLHVSKKVLKSDNDLIEEFSKTVAKEVKIEQPFYYIMHHEDTQKGIDNFVDSVGADLIAMSMRKRGILEKLLDSSLSKRMAYQARIPLLVFHAVQGRSNE
jgi:nucleotide-binding universal stress UspA family protein